MTFQPMLSAAPTKNVVAIQGMLDVSSEHERVRRKGPGRNQQSAATTDPAFDALNEQRPDHRPCGDSGQQEPEPGAGQPEWTGPDRMEREHREQRRRGQVGDPNAERERAQQPVPREVPDSLGDVCAHPTRTRLSCRTELTDQQ